MCCLGHLIPSFIRHAAHFGFDCIWLDAEHRAFSDREIQALLAYFHLCDIDCMLRPPTLEKTRLYRYLEDGATGLMIPHVSTPEKAQILVDAVKFPPVGDRGLDAAGLDSDFLLHSGADDYVAHANRETFLVVQIETPQAIENVDAIAAINGVDALFLGPADLSLRIRHQKAHYSLDEAIANVANAAARHGKAWGCPGPTAERVQDLYAQGARLIPYGGDFGCLMQMLENNGKELEGIYGGEAAS